MASKKVNGLNGAHTAGIFSDMTVDGPEIGTLVVIVDRAKNLPNRKTIGKQDPYCAARLGKEAKKTETDRRGGQTPRWYGQFLVYRDIARSYANTKHRDQELRFTVHDSPDYYQLKVSVFNDDKKTDLIGETWVNLQEVVIPGGGQNDLWHNLNCKGKYAGEVRIEITYYDSRPKQEKPEKVRNAGANGVVAEEGRDSLRGPRQQKAPVKRRPLPSDPVTGAPPPQIDNSPPRPYLPPTAIPEHVRTPTRGNQSPGFVPNQSPLQSVEYHTPPQRIPQSQGYGGNPGGMNGFGSSPDIFAASPVAQEPHNGRYEIHDPIPMDLGNSVPKNDFYRHEQSFRKNSFHEHSNSYEEPYEYQHSPYELPHQDEFGTPPSPGGPPPPPPAHRSRHNSERVSPAPPLRSQGSYGFAPDQRPTSSYEIPQPDMHRKSMPAIPHANSYQPYSTPTKDDPQRRGPQQPGPRHNSYDSRYDNNYESMQPTVEDAPPTPTSASRAMYEERRYDQSASPAPLNLSGRASAASGRYAPSTAPSTQLSYSNGYGSSNSPISFRDQQSTVSSQTSYNPLPQKVSRNYSDESTGSGDRMGDYGTPESYGLPPVPPTLVAGMDPSIAQEISDRMYAEKRASYTQNGGNSQRGRTYESPQFQPSRPHPLQYQESAAPFVPAASMYDERQSRYATAVVPHTKSRAISPDPRVPMRKSVSPSPAPSTPDGRRLSGIPFGPDSYNALNPATGSPAPASISAQYEKEDPDAKIILHDGREIDPSDHIPESNYAPLLEPKGPKYASQQPDRNYRASPGSRQPNPVTGRTPLRQAAPRPQSVANSSPIHFHSGNTYSDPSTPQTARNRLQKKSNRMSAQPAPHSSPLAPLNSYQDNGYSPAPRQTRANTADFSTENYAPQHYGGSPGYRGSAPPPIPAKVPDYQVSNGQANGSDPWALLEEMKNIDLGTGRARRRGGY